MSMLSQVKCKANTTGLTTRELKRMIKILVTITRLVKCVSIMFVLKRILVFRVCSHRRTRRGGGGAWGLQPPRIFQISHFRAKKHVIFGQDHLVFGQALEKIFGQLTSASSPLNETGPVCLCLFSTLDYCACVHDMSLYVSQKLTVCSGGVLTKEINKKTPKKGRLIDKFDGQVRR